MGIINEEPTQSLSPPPINSPPMETKKYFSFTLQQIFFGIIGGLFLLFLFVLGVWFGEKRTLRKQLIPEVQPTPTTILPTPTTVPTLTPSPDSSTGGRTGRKEIPTSGTVCERDVDCLNCFAIPGTTIVDCNAGRCVEGICVWPTSPPPARKR